jgi:hypothetical protein
MANTLTGLIPILYQRLDVISRELVGMIPSVSRDSGAEAAAVGQTVRSPVSRAATIVDVTPGVTAPNAGDQTFDTIDMTIDKARAAQIRWNGEEQLSVSNGNGVGWQSLFGDEVEQGFRAICNEVETDLVTIAGLGASRAYGASGTALFGSTNQLGEAAQLRKILDDNGAPPGTRSLVIGTTEGAALRTLTTLTKVNEAGTNMTLRQGELLDLFNFSLKESAQITSFTKGTNSGATTDATGYAKFSTSFTLASAGTGTILAGDLITFAGDANIYQVVTGDADVSNGGTITIAKPGILIAMSAATKAITTVGNTRRNFGFSRNAIHLVTRPPAVPKGGDAAAESTLITDPRSGLTFDVRLYKQYRQNYIEIALAWGKKVQKAEHLAMLVA